MMMNGLNRRKSAWVTMMLVVGAVLISNAQVNRFEISENKAEKRVDITVDGKPFTSYRYADSLKKPVLFPIHAAQGSLVTRGWPLDPRSGERMDHPHHVGLWFTYGDVNGLDFWNNSTSIPEEKKHEYGTIKHASVNKITADQDQAELAVSAYWEKTDGTPVLKEDTRYIFTAIGERRAIELVVNLTALTEDVAFADNKEGLIGIRVARELEHPSDEHGGFTDLNKVDVTGIYRSSEGKEGDGVWGTRAKWVKLTGEIENKPVSIVILDHPENVGYPTYWHARGYGLFAANPLGQKEFSKGKEVLNFKLRAGESVVFTYKVLIHSGEELSDRQVNLEAEKFERIHF